MIEMNVKGDSINFKNSLVNVVKDLIGLKLNRNYPTEEGEVYMLVGQSYAFRTGSDLTTTVILEFIGNSKAICTIMASGGASGLCGIDFGTQKANERTIADKIAKFAETNELSVKITI